MLKSAKFQTLSLMVAALFASSQGYSQKYSNEFLSIGVDARAHGMGTVGVATVSDVAAGYWNPAGLMHFNDDLQFTFMHAAWFGNIASYDYGAVAFPISNRKSRLAASFIRLGIDNIPNTLSLFNDDGTIDYTSIQQFSAADVGVLLSYATNITKIEGLSVGGNVKIINRIVGTFASSWGFGLDLGAQYRKKNWMFGLSMRDITGTFNAWSFNFTEDEKKVLGITGNEIPISSVEVTKPKIILGAAWHKDFVVNQKKVDAGAKTKTIGITGELNVDCTTDGKRNVLVSTTVSLDPHVGIELDYNKLVFLRAGINNIQQISTSSTTKEWVVQPNMGLGINLGKFARIDYAYSNFGSSSGALYSHVISGIVKLQMKKKK